MILKEMTDSARAKRHALHGRRDEKNNGAPIREETYLETCEGR